MTQSSADSFDDRRAAHEGFHAGLMLILSSAMPRAQRRLRNEAAVGRGPTESVNNAAVWPAIPCVVGKTGRWHAATNTAGSPPPMHGPRARPTTTLSTNQPARQRSRTIITSSIRRCRWRSEVLTCASSSVRRKPAPDSGEKLATRSLVSFDDGRTSTARRHAGLMLILS